MKSYDFNQIVRAKEKLGRPLADFLDSDAFIKIMSGIKDKLKLSDVQGGTAVEVITATLLKLEPESAFETNIHQMLPELSNEQTRELVGDIRDRIFKEAARRIEENVTEPKFDWDEQTLGAKPTIEELEALKTKFHEATEHPVSLDELQKQAAEDARIAEEKEDAEDREYLATHPDVADTEETEILTVPNEPPEKQNIEPARPLSAAPTIAAQKLQAPPSLAENSLRIAEQKLQAPTTVQQSQVAAEKPLAEPEASAEKLLSTPSVTTVPPTPARPVGRDVYREPVD